MPVRRKAFVEIAFARALPEFGTAISTELRHRMSPATKPTPGDIHLERQPGIIMHCRGDHEYRAPMRVHLLLTWPGTASPDNTGMLHLKAGQGAAWDCPFSANWLIPQMGQ